MKVPREDILRVGIPRDQGRSCLVFNNLAVEPTWNHFLYCPHGLLVDEATALPDFRGGELSLQLDEEGKVTLLKSIEYGKFGQIQTVIVIVIAAAD